MSAVVLSRSDITERHPNEALLPKLSRAVEQSPLATVISEIECVTEATTRLTGFGRDEALGLARTALQPAHRPTALAALAALATSLQQAQALTDSSPHVVLQPGCARVVDRAQAKGPSRPLQADDLPDALRGDPTRLRQALLNLLSNAVKFTDRGSIVVQVERLAPRGEGAQGLEARAPPPAGPGGRIGLRFRVQDTGIGLASGQLDTLLPVFSQADSATNRRCGGTGLGLSVTRRLAAMMGGGWACRWTWPTTALTRGLACSASPMT